MRVLILILFILQCVMGSVVGGPVGQPSSLKCQALKKTAVQAQELLKKDPQDINTFLDGFLSKTKVPEDIREILRPATFYLIKANQDIDLVLFVLEYELRKLEEHQKQLGDGPVGADNQEQIDQHKRVIAFFNNECSRRITTMYKHLADLAWEYSQQSSLERFFGNVFTLTSHTSSFLVNPPLINRRIRTVIYDPFIDSKNESDPVLQLWKQRKEIDPSENISFSKVIEALLLIGLGSNREKVTNLLWGTVYRIGLAHDRQDFYEPKIENDRYRIIQLLIQYGDPSILLMAPSSEDHYIGEVVARELERAPELLQLVEKKVAIERKH